MASNCSAMATTMPHWRKVILYIRCLPSYKERRGHALSRKLIKCSVCIDLPHCVPAKVLSSMNHLDTYLERHSNVYSMLPLHCRSFWIGTFQQGKCFLRWRHLCFSWARNGSRKFRHLGPSTSGFTPSGFKSDAVSAMGTRGTSHVS